MLNLNSFNVSVLKCREFYLQMYINQSLEVPPSIPDFEISLEDATTLNVAIKKDQSINDLFNHLSAKGILVSSMRNQSNRLEEMFIEMSFSSSKF